MQNWLKGASIALASAAIALAVSQMMRDPAAGQTPDADVLRTADGRPDLNGIWQAVGTAHWNLQDHQARTGPVLELGATCAVPAGLSVVEGNEIPYQPWAAAKQTRELRQLADQGPGGQVLPAGAAARDLHAVSVSDPADRQQRHPHGVRVRQRQPRHQDGEGGAAARGHLDGTIGRPLGG